MKIEIEKLEQVMIDGVNAGDIVSAISNYPPKLYGEILSALQAWRDRYEGQADQAALLKAKTEFDQQIKLLTQQLSEANQQIVDLRSQLESTSQKIVSQEEILKRLEALEAKQ
jgi:phage shock protein A